MRRTIHLLHGWSMASNNRDKWQPFIQQLAKRKIEGVFLPIPGLDSELKTAWHLDDYVQWLADQLPKREANVILGHSFGGQLAIRFAAQYPERVKQLILIDSAGIRDQSFLLRLKRSLFKSLAKIGKTITQSELLRKWLYRLAREQDYYQASPIMRQTMQYVLNKEIRRDLSDVVCNTCIIWGGNDRATPLHLAKQLHTGITKSELHIIKAARHSPHFTHPNTVVDIISRYLAV